MTPDALLERLEGVSPRGMGQWSARCPAHSDTSPSLSIQEANGKILLHCFAGCEVDSITEAMGVAMKELFTDTSNGQALRKTTRIFDYTDEGGSLLYQVVREDLLNGKKDFKQRRPGENGGWIWKLEDTRRVLYRLPHILQEADAPIVIHEGEKAVESAVAADLPGVHTTTAGGSNAPDKTDFSAVKGREVIICPDNDQSGEDYLHVVADMAKAARALSVKVLRLPGLPKKGDVVEWVQAGGRPEAFDALLKGAEAFDGVPLHSGLSAAVVSYSDLLALKLQERPSYLPWLMEGGNVMVFGPRGVGKTFFQLGLTGALTSGGTLWSWQVKQPVGVLYVDGEMRIKELRDRLTALMNIPPAAPLKFLTSELVYQRCGGKDLILTSDAMRQGVVKILDAHPDIKVLILDNISCLFSGINEDSKQDWEPINAWLIRLRHRGLATVLVHHSGKGGQQRGTSGREDSLDTVIQLSKPSGADAREGCHFELAFTKCRSVTGDEVAPLDIRLQTVNGSLQWAWQPVEVSTREKVLKLYLEGVESPTDIAEEIGCTKGTASKIIKRLKAEGAL